MINSNTRGNFILEKCLVHLLSLQKKTNFFPPILWKPIFKIQVAAQKKQNNTCVRSYLLHKNMRPKNQNFPYNLEMFGKYLKIFLVLNTEVFIFVQQKRAHI